MKGTIEVKSQKGKGTTTTAVIPSSICQPPTQQQDTDEVLASKRRKIFQSVGRNILIVDDNAVNCKILKHYLEQKGHCCQIVHTGQEAVERATAYNYDIVFMDIEMPILNVQLFQ